MVTDPMTRRRCATRYASISIVLGLAVLGALAISGADAARTERHSGSVLAIDPQGGVMILGEIGPWRVERGRTVVTRRTVTLTPATKFNLFMRVDMPGAFAGDFIEVALEAEDVSSGDFVTAECVRERGRLVALTVTVAELGEP